MNEKLKKQRILTLRFKTSIFHNEVEMFRGAVNEALKDDSNTLFHNHEGEKLRYSYPLIQYKRINRNAALVCINEGIEAITLLLKKGSFEIRLGNRTTELEIDSVKANQHLIQTWDSSFTYYLRKWLPLNQENYDEYQKLEGVAEKSLFLENILKANILSFAKGLNVFFEKQIECKITRLSEPTLIRYKNVKLTMFDAEFVTNVSIPDYVGLGKGVSIGYGVTVRKKKSKQLLQIK